MLATYDEISTRPEPWVLLPQIYALREFGISADYRHPLLVNTLNEFIRELPGGHAAYYDEVRSLALNLYAKASDPPTQYFLDKSPPYSLVAEDVIRLFPEGKFVFLWRNPLGVLSSWIETFFDNRWRPTTFGRSFSSGSRTSPPPTSDTARMRSGFDTRICSSATSRGSG